jgi:Cu+-exporting ATPase
MSGTKEGSHNGGHRRSGKGSEALSVKDPVCGMDVVPERAAGASVHEGETYFFCSKGCLAKFQADPTKFLGGDSRAAGDGHGHVATAQPGVIYTCPMHPEIKKNGPGNCPICGMALEPLMPTSSEESSPELRDMSRRFWVSLVLTLPVLAVAMGEMVPPLRHLVLLRLAVWLQLALSTPVVLWGGWPFFARG